MKKYLLLLALIMPSNGVKAIPSEIVAQIVQRYRAGEKVAVIASDLGVSNSTVSEYARKARIQLRKGKLPLHAIPLKIAEEIEERLRAGETRSAVAQALGLRPAVVDRYPKRVPSIKFDVSERNIDSALQQKTGSVHLDVQQQSFDDIRHYLNSEFFDQ